MSDYTLQQLIYGDTEINIDSNGLWNATALVKAYNQAHSKGKRLNDWLRSDFTKEIIQALINVSDDNTAVASSKGFDDYVRTVARDPQFGGGTWIHPDLVLPIAHWLSPTFYIWCNQKLQELLTKERQESNLTIKSLKIENCKLAPLRPLLEQPRLEKYVQKLLEISLDGYHGHYLKLESGIPDIISEKFLVEIKKASDWKHCLGQLQAYRGELMETQQYDDRVAIGYLFDNEDWLTDRKKAHIKRRFNQLGFEVWWHTIIEDEDTVAHKTVERDAYLDQFLTALEKRDALYICTAPDGVKTYTSKLKDYCAKNKLDYGSCLKYIRKVKTTPVRGFTFDYASEAARNETQEQKKKRAANKSNIVAQCISTNKTFIITDVVEFTRHRGIKNPGNIYAVLNKKELKGSIRKTAYGYRYWYIYDCPLEVLYELNMESDGL